MGYSPNLLYYGPSGEFAFMAKGKDAPDKVPIDTVSCRVASAIDKEKLRWNLMNPEERVSAFSKEGFLVLDDEEFLRTSVLKEGWEEMSKTLKTPRNTATKWRGHMKDLAGDKAADKAVMLEEFHPDKLPEIYGFSTYFGVLKTEELARAILNAKRINDMFLRPWSINLADPPRAVKTMARMLIPKLQKLMREGGDGKIWMVSIDWRHYFHQFEAGGYLKRFFGLAINDERGEQRYYTWKNLPMGWSWAPYVAQCLGWHFLLFYNPTFGKKAHEMDSPPMFVETKDQDGLVFLYIDNVHGYFTSREAAVLFIKGVLRNMKYYNVAEKYIYLDGQPLKYSAPEMNDMEEFHKAPGKDLEHITLVNAVDKDGKELPKEKPSALGLEFEVEPPYGVRLVPDKVEKLPETLEQETIRCPREAASLTGKILYLRSLNLEVQARSRHLVLLLSQAGKYVSQQGGIKAWDDKNYHTTLTEEILEALAEGSNELIPVAVPGIRNVSDWASRDKPLPDTYVHKGEVINPIEESWRIIRSGYMGRRERIPLIEGINSDEPSEKELKLETVFEMVHTAAGGLDIEALMEEEKEFLSQTGKRPVEGREDPKDAPEPKRQRGESATKAQ